MRNATLVTTMFVGVLAASSVSFSTLAAAEQATAKTPEVIEKAAAAPVSLPSSSGTIRRVVTGHDVDGKAVFVSDEEVSPVTLESLPGLEFHQLWGADTPSRYPDDGAAPRFKTYFPPIGGVRFGIFTVPPDAPATGDAPDGAALVAELERKLPGLAQYLEAEEAGMHTTPTTDFEVVLSGHVILELDNGAIVRLGPGDTVVQNGTRHRWRNDGTVPAVVAAFIVGAHHKKF
jgi:mannose-6-phosphate isomerase-like protein (cupin superfamily)